MREPLHANAPGLVGREDELERAASAFTDAFNTGMIVSAAIAIAADAIVLRTLSPSQEGGAAAAAAASDVEVELPRAGQR